jgi:hypothetical protein
MKSIVFWDVTTLNMEAVGSSGRIVDFHRTTQSHILEKKYSQHVNCVNSISAYQYADI